MTDSFDQTPLQHHPDRWRLSRAGFVNVWHYLENTFDMFGGRIILRGTNGSGKSRALEMLLPFLLDADRRNMGTGSAVRMEDLMSAGAEEQGNRLGYMWLELRRDLDQETRYLTVGALVRFAISTKEAKVWYFTTPLRVGPDLPLLGTDRQPLSRRDLAERVTDERITDVPEKHRERIRAEVFGLTGQLGKDRFDGLVKLLHTLRSPDVGNRIEEGRLPAILADALPPLSEDALTDAGQQLDGLTSTREDQERLEAAREQVSTFLEAYRKYATGVLTTSLERVRTSAVSARTAAGHAHQLADATATLEAEVTAKRGAAAELDEQADTLEATVAALRESEAYRNATELSQLAKMVESRAEAADTALGAASGLRRDEADRVRATGPLAGDVEQAARDVVTELRELREHLLAAGVTAHDLPSDVHVVRRPGAPASDVVRIVREGEPEDLVRPVADALTVVPADLTALADTAHRVRAVAEGRSAQAVNRAADARTLTEEQRRIAVLAGKAADAEERAKDDEADAQQAVEVRDDLAMDLVDRWRAWIADPLTADLLGGVEWSDHPTLGPLLLDRTALCRDASAPSAEDLDRAADDVVTDAREPLATALSRLGDADAEDRRRVVELGEERAQLSAARDPDPSSPPWVTVSDGVALWRCLDFAADLDAGRRAGVEAALLASGLLTATVDAAGQLVTAQGQLVVSPIGELVEAPLTSVLTPDPECPLPVEAVVAVLERVALDDPTATTWIGHDGSWGNGALRGRHAVPAARHIGAAARASARATRIAEIDIVLSELAAGARSRQEERDRLQGRQRALRDLHRAAPRSTALTQGRTRATASIRQAAKSASTGRQLRNEADELTRVWAAREREHRRACSEFGLPADEDALQRLRGRADRAARGCATVAAGALSIDKAMVRYAAAAAALHDFVGRRAQAELDAAAAWRIWHGEMTRLAVLREAVGDDVRAVQQKVAQAENALQRNKRDLHAMNGAVQRLEREVGTAGANAQSAATLAAGLRTSLAEETNAAVTQLHQPGVGDTAFTSVPDPVFGDPAVDAVEADAKRLLAALRRGKSDENALLRAQQAFEQAISGSYDVAATVSAGIRLFELLDADGRRPLAQAAVEIDRQCTAGRAALTAREQQVFTDFVLGEVGEELRRRLGQAGTLISEMNRSLRSIRTSHGIGVRLTWKLADEVSGDIGRIKELITTAAAVRTAAQDHELTALLSARVAAEAVRDPTAGYAIHLRGALDYREWHSVEVIITGPEAGRERRISRRAKLSQGETRFVSYVTLFAAVDAYLSGLEDTGMSLRLILLDDAFAKVDEPTIAELLGLLVRLDVDFVMTGHALWGCVPQVPALDIYEICREDGTPAATAHVRWDGRNRHFLHAT